MRIIEIIAESGHIDTLKGIAEQHGVVDYWCGPEGDDGRRWMRMLVSPEQRQTVLDALQNVLGTSPKTRILILPIEASLPREEPPEQAEPAKTTSPATTREELYDKIEKGARLDGNFVLLVCLSTIVAAIGLIEDNVAVVVGAMVIAPLLGPNIALAFAAALGDSPLMWKSLKTNLAGLLLAGGMSFVIGILWPVNLESREILARTDVGLDGIVLALASGAAAVLSLATGLPTALVGVMVAVALLPPTAVLGMTLGTGQPNLAVGAGLLLAVNVVCVNLAAKLVFLSQGVKPRTWLEKRKARQSVAAYLLLWLASLVILVGAIYLRRQLNG